MGQLESSIKRVCELILILVGFDKIYHVIQLNLKDWIELVFEEKIKI